jgi:hypothetical protein
MQCPKDKTQMTELAFIRYYPNRYLAPVPVVEHYWKCYRCGRDMMTKTQLDRNIATKALGFNVK